MEMERRERERREREREQREMERRERERRERERERREWEQVQERERRHGLPVQLEDLQREILQSLDQAFAYFSRDDASFDSAYEELE